MNQYIARENMVKWQVRPWDVYTPKVLHLMYELPREYFVPKKYYDSACIDFPIPLPGGQQMLPPNQIGRILDCLNISKNSTVLEIGTGSGYLTGLLAKLGAKVTSYEINKNVYSYAKHNLEHALNKKELDNIDLCFGNGVKEVGTGKKFQHIICTAAMPQLIDNVVDMLYFNGSMFSFIGENFSTQACLIINQQNGILKKPLFDCNIDNLIGIPSQKEFVF